MKTYPDVPINTVDGCYADEMSKRHAGIGLTKREHFAAMAMQGLLSACYINEDLIIGPHISRLSIEQADALIAELNKEKS